MIETSPLPIAHACRTLGVSRQGFYKWKQQEPAESKDIEILAAIQEIAAEFPKYGYRRVTHALRRDDHVVNKKKVHRLMKENGLLVRRKKSKPITTQSHHGLPKYHNLTKGIVLTGINQIWVSDITYIWLLCEFVYLALVMDLFSRRCIGWALSRNPDTQLTLDALNRAIALRGAENVKGCIHHSDQGVQYCSHRFVQRVVEVGMRSSMGEVGNSYENAYAESVIKTIKYEEVYMNEYETIEDVYCNIERFIEEVYNKKRLHSSIGYKPPLEFEKEALNSSGA